MKLWSIAGLQLHIEGKAPAKIPAQPQYGHALPEPWAAWEWPLHSVTERADEWFRQPRPKWWELAWGWGLVVAKAFTWPALIAMVAFGAAFYFESHDVKKQLRRATNQLWKQPQFVQAWNEIGWNNYDGATLCLDAVNESYRNLPLYLSARALVAFGENDLSSAHRFAERALERDPKQLDALGVMMRIHFVAGRLRDAGQLATRLTDLSPDNSFAWHWRARIEYAAHDLDSAESSAQKALQLHPSDTFSIAVLARVTANRAGCDAGTQILDAALKQLPKHPHLLETKAELLRDAHRFEEALAAVEAALQEAPQALSLRSAHLLTLARLGRVDGLATEAQVLLADPRIESAARNTVARALSLGGELELALPVFARLAQEHPDSFSSQNDYGYTLLCAGDPKGAMPVLQRAVQLDPQERIGWENLMNCAIALGRTDVQAQCAAELAKIMKP
jgi:tetratricopeptide (TPR) repeat protein